MSLYLQSLSEISHDFLQHFNCDVCIFFTNIYSQTSQLKYCKRLWEISERDCKNAPRQHACLKDILWMSYKRHL